ncbi:MAG: sigma-70 family RNA polymerase sigma factor [candidate division WOR-3 bacterium]
MRSIAIPLPTQEAEQDLASEIYHPDVTRRLTEKVVQSFKLCEADALEIVSLAQSKAYQNRHRYNPLKLTVSAWLWVITSRVAISWLRKHKGISIHNIGSAQDLPESLHPTSADPAEIYWQKVRKERLWILLNQLPKMERDVLILYYMKDYSYQTVAKRLNITQRQARYLANKGLARIRSFYGGRKVEYKRPRKL